jgi:hypothetical protein
VLFAKNLFYPHSKLFFLKSQIEELSTFLKRLSNIIQGLILRLRVPVNGKAIKVFLKREVPNLFFPLRGLIIPG